MLVKIKQVIINMFSQQLTLKLSITSAMDLGETDLLPNPMEDSKTPESQWPSTHKIFKSSLAIAILVKELLQKELTTT